MPAYSHVSVSVCVCLPNWPDIHYAFYARQQRTDRQADWERDWTGCWSFNAFADAVLLLLQLPAQRLRLPNLCYSDFEAI